MTNKRNVTQEILGQDGHCGEYYNNREYQGQIQKHRETRDKGILRLQACHFKKIRDKINKKYGSIEKFCKKSLYQIDVVKYICEGKIDTKKDYPKVINLLRYLEIPFNTER